jgi:hypothetical protein
MVPVEHDLDLAGACPQTTGSSGACPQTTGSVIHSGALPGVVRPERRVMAM